MTESWWIASVNRNGQASAFVERRPNPSAMSGDNGTAQSQAHAEAVLFGGHKRRKNLLKHRHRHPFSAVADGDLDPAIYGPGLEGQFQLGAAAVLHGFAGVDDEIEKHLLDLNGVRADEG